jgi:hypothetical protein
MKFALEFLHWNDWRMMWIFYMIRLLTLFDRSVVNVVLLLQREGAKVVLSEIGLMKKLLIWLRLRDIGIKN